MNLSENKYIGLKLKILEYGVCMRNIGIYNALPETQDKARYSKYDAQERLEEILEDISLLYDRKPASTVVKDDQSHEQEIL